MDVHVDVNEKPRQSPGRGLLRRRIVFELDEEQMPLLASAEERHGTKRAAMLAALAAEEQLEQLGERADQAEQELAKAERTAKAGAAKQTKAAKKAERQLAAMRKRLADQEGALSAAESEAAQAEDLRRERDQLSEVLGERNEQLAEAQARAVDWLYCARCEKWAPPSEWAWRRIEGKGSYAFHRSCGDHRPGLLGAASWLAQRRR